MMMLEGKKALVFGVANERSIDLNAESRLLPNTQQNRHRMLRSVREAVSLVQKITGKLRLRQVHMPELGVNLQWLFQ